MIWNNTLNLIQLYDKIDDILQNYYYTNYISSIYPNNTFTSFYLDVRKCNVNSLSSLDIVLVGCDGGQIDFKTIANVDELLLQNNYLIYKNLYEFISQINGIYYFKISSSTKILYSNLIHFGATWTLPIVSENMTIKMTGQTITFQLRALEAINLNVYWGDGSDSTMVVDTSSGTATKTYSASGTYTITISGYVNRIKTINIDSTPITDILNFEKCVNLTRLQAINSDLQNVPFSQVKTLTYVDVSRTEIRSIKGVELSPITHLNISSTSYYLTQDLANNAIISKLGLLENLICENNPISYIDGGDIGQANYVDNIKQIKLKGSNFQYISTIGQDQQGIQFDDLQIYDMSYNWLVGNITNTQLLKPTEGFIKKCISYDFSYNNISKIFFDDFLRLIALYRCTDSFFVYIDLSGYSKLNSLNNESPTIGVEFLTLVNGGTGFAVNDTITPTNGGGAGAIFTVKAVNSGVITELELTNKGVGYDEAITTFTTSGSGTSYTITAESAVYRIKNYGHVLNYN